MRKKFAILVVLFSFLAAPANGSLFESCPRAAMPVVGLGIFIASAGIAAAVRYEERETPDEETYFTYGLVGAIGGSLIAFAPLISCSTSEGCLHFIKNRCCR